MSSAVSHAGSGVVGRLTRPKLSEFPRCPLGLPKVTGHRDSAWERFPRWSGGPHIEKKINYREADFSAYNKGPSLA